jgi:hypothetical protein
LIQAAIDKIGDPESSENARATVDERAPCILTGADTGADVVTNEFRQTLDRLGPVDNQQVQMKAAESATNDENRSESLS